MNAADKKLMLDFMSYLDHEVESLGKQIVEETAKLREHQDQFELLSRWRGSLRRQMLEQK